MSFVATEPETESRVGCIKLLAHLVRCSLEVIRTRQVGFEKYFWFSACTHRNSTRRKALSQTSALSSDFLPLVVGLKALIGASCCPSHCRTWRCGSLAPRSTCPCPLVYLPACLPACLSICFSHLTFPPRICTKGGRQECSGRHASMHARRHRTRTPAHKRVSEHDSEREREI